MFFRLFAFLAVLAVAFASPKPEPKPEPQVISYAGGVYPAAYTGYSPIAYSAPYVAGLPYPYYVR